MSITSLGILGSLASTPLPQRAAGADKAEQDAQIQDRTQQAAEKAENAAGIGQTEEDAQTSDRDADGRRVWELNQQSKKSAEDAAVEEEAPRAKDPTGTAGGELDLVG
jgi:hypothetical protein